MNAPMNFNGKLTSKIIINGFVREDETSALYVQVFLNSERKKIPLNISVRHSEFDKKKQRVKKNNDFNLIIEKALSDLHQIELEYRLKNMALNIETLMKEYFNPSPKIDFIKFYEYELENQKKILKASSYKQQKSVLKKLKTYRSNLFFSDFTLNFLEEYKKYMTNTLKNKPLTVFGSIKNIKKYLHLAEKSGLIAPIRFNDIKVKREKSHRTFLDESELTLMREYYQNKFIPEVQKNVLQRFLFSCFTGLRISDIGKLTKKSFDNNKINFVAEKTLKIQTIPLANSALEYYNVDGDFVFNGIYTEQHINRTLKDICNYLGIKKNISFHVSRHTFATRFLRRGGNVVVLKDLLGHSSFNDTMIYIHVLGLEMENQIKLLD